MDQAEKRQLENELTVMGLPGLDSPELIQAMADIVNGFPYPAERAAFFCDLLNECEGARRREMYEAMRPRLSFDVPSLFECEARIAEKAERLITYSTMTMREIAVACGFLSLPLFSRSFRARYGRPPSELRA